MKADFSLLPPTEGSGSSAPYNLLLFTSPLIALSWVCPLSLDSKALWPRSPIVQSHLLLLVCTSVPSEAWSSVPRTLPAFQTLLTLIPSSKAGLPLSPLHSQVPWGLRGSGITFPELMFSIQSADSFVQGFFLGFHPFLGIFLKCPSMTQELFPCLSFSHSLSCPRSWASSGFNRVECFCSYSHPCKERWEVG